MKKKLTGVLLAASLSVGAVGLNATPASANGDSTDPVLCFVAAFAIITEALQDYQAGHLSGADLRSVLVGTSSFLSDCLTPTT